MRDLFEPADATEPLDAGAVLLRGLAAPEAPALLAALDAVLAVSPFRHLTTRGGFTMSVAMTNCGTLGWVSDRRGYRYDGRDPLSDAPWPAIPAPFLALARRAAAQAGYDGFAPQACLVNRYVPGARLSLHQDRDEENPLAPIVSVSLGLDATFLWGGMARADPVRRLRLSHGDVVVWGGPSRFAFHGVAPLKPGQHPQLGERRINLTFRQVR